MQENITKNNKKQWQESHKKELPALIGLMDEHLKDSIQSGGLPKLEKLYNMSKGSKDDAPLDGFINYYAYKTEERKYNLRYNKQLDQV